MYLSFFPWGSFQFQAILVQENALYDFNFLEFVEACFVSYHVVYLWKRSMYVWKECVFCFFGWKVMYISDKHIWSNVSFSATVSLLIVWKISLLLTMGCKTPYYKCIAVYIFLEALQDFPYIFGCSYIGCIYVYNVYSFLVDSSL